MSKLEDLWAQAAANPGTPIDIGPIVVCDLCDEDWTTRTESGGFVFQSKAVCPKCADRHLRQITLAHEEHYIRARCPLGQSFADFVRAYRGGNNSIRIGPVRVQS